MRTLEQSAEVVYKTINAIEKGVANWKAKEGYNQTRKQLEMYPTDYRSKRSKDVQLMRKQIINKLCFENGISPNHITRVMKGE